MPDSKKSSSNSPLISHIFEGGGEMGNLMALYDWDNHPLGSPEHWPQSLQTGLRMILNSSFPMYIWWSEELYMFYNDPYIPALGKKHPKALGSKARVIWNEVWTQLGEMFEGIIKTGKAHFAEDQLIFLERKGFLEETYWTFSVSSMPDDDGKLSGVFCACHDVTNKVLAQRRFKILKDISDAATEFLSIEQACQQASEILDQNKADIPYNLIYLLNEEEGLAKLVGHSPEIPEAMLLSVVNLASSEQMDLWQMNKVLKNKEAEFIKDISSRFGLSESEVNIDHLSNSAVVAIFNPGTENILGFLILGISPKLIYNEDYQNFHSLLSKALGDAINTIHTRNAIQASNEELSNANHQLSLVNADLDNFVYTASHDLKSPIISMGGLLSLLKKKLPGKLDENSKVLLEHLTTSVNKLKQTIEDLSEIVKVTKDQDLPRESILFEDVLEDVLSDPIPELKYVKVNIVKDLKVNSIEYPKKHLRSILYNLLSNAVKYRHPEREPEIKISTEDKDGKTQLCVSDNGMGMTDRQLKKLFGMFQRMHPHIEGSGIGLYTIKRIIETDGGEIRVESKAGEGTAFYVIF